MRLGEGDPRSFRPLRGTGPWAGKRASWRRGPGRRRGRTGEGDSSCLTVTPGGRRGSQTSVTGAVESWQELCRRRGFSAIFVKRQPAKGLHPRSGKQPVNRSVASPLVCAHHLPVGLATPRLLPWRRLSSQRPTTCPGSPRRPPATSVDDPPRSDATARNAPHPPAPSHPTRRTPSGTPSATRAGSTATGTTSATD